MNLRLKLMLFAGVAALIIILTTAGFLYTRLWNDRYDALRVNISRQLDSVDFMLRMYFDEVERGVSALADNALVRSRDDRRFTSFVNADEQTFRYSIGEQEQGIIDLFNTYRSTNSFTSSVYMGRENGSFIRSHRHARPSPYDPRDQPWYRLAKKNPEKVVKTDPYSASQTQDINIGVVKALVDTQGEFFGVVGIVVTLSTLTEYSYVLNYKLIPEGQFLLLDKNGIVLASQDNRMLFKDIREFSEDFSDLLRDARSGVATIRVGADKKYVAFREASREGWRSAVLVPHGYIETQIRDIVTLATGGMALGLFLMGAITLVALHFFVGRPIRGFIHEIDHVAETGHLDRTIKIHSRDEIGDLAKSFNRMIDALGQTQQSLIKAQRELREYQNSLEGLVRGRTQELAVAMTRAQEADRLKSAFLATMSHELRTPLNSIIGFTGILLQGLAGPLNEEQAKQLGMVRGSSRHLLDLINDVLDLSKIEAGQLEVVQKPFDMRAVIEQVMRTVAPQAQKKGLALLVGLASDVGVIFSDRRRVEQILLNLISNAIKFTERGEVRIECRRRGDWLETAVRDTGMGIRAEDLGKLFEPFRQLDTGLARRQEGSGLGLSICKRLLELLGGTIRAESVWGEGSTFTFTLPNPSLREVSDGADDPGHRR